MSKKFFYHDRFKSFSHCSVLFFLVILFAVLFSELFFSCSKQKQNKNVLKIATEFGYPPFEYLDDDAKTLIGFDVDMWNEICRRLDMIPRYEDVQWSGIFSALEAERFDCIISAVTITKERKEKFLITRPYVLNSECFIVRAGNKSNYCKENENDFSDSEENLFSSDISLNAAVLDSPKKLSGLKVGFQAETVSDVYVTDLLISGIKFETFEYDKLMDAFDDLKYGRVDVVVAESVAAKNLVKKNSDIYRIDYIAEPDAEFGILVNKKNPELFEKIEVALDSMYADGFMNQLENKWLK